MIKLIRNDNEPRPTYSATAKQAAEPAGVFELIPFPLQMQF